MTIRESMLGRYTRCYDDVWSAIERGAATCNNAFWLMGAANYIFSINGVRFAVDPMFNTPRSGETFRQVGQRAIRLLDACAFILITHEHVDHFDPRLMESCRRAQWFVPAFLAAQLPKGMRNVTLLRGGDRFQIGAFQITAFDSLHYDAGTDIGVPELGYFIEAGDKRLLMPGDVREYDAGKLPRFDDVTHFFAHVWLGRGNALNWPCGDYPEQMARFVCAFRPTHVYLTHLLEAARGEKDLWTYAHAGLVTDAVLALDPGLRVRTPLLGETVSLEEVY